MTEPKLIEESKSVPAEKKEIVIIADDYEGSDEEDCNEVYSIENIVDFRNRRSTDTMKLEKIKINPFRQNQMRKIVQSINERFFYSRDMKPNNSQKSLHDSGTRNSLMDDKDVPFDDKHMMSDHKCTEKKPPTINIQ